MDTYEAITTRRSIREFIDKPVAYDLLEKFVNAGRLAPQAANRQPLEFVVVDESSLLERFFNATKLAGYLDWKPSQEKMAQAYIVILANINIQKSHWISFDAALAAENIALAAWDEGVGSCMIGDFNKAKVAEMLDIPIGYEVMLVIALGYPAHKSFAEDAKGDSMEYRRDEDGNFHVPKRPLKKIIHRNRFHSE